MLGQGKHAEVEQLRAQLTSAFVEKEAAIARAEKVEVQLAGCGAAAMGAIAPHVEEAKPGDYGYSASYGDVVKIRRELETLRAENERLRGEIAARDNRIDDDTKTIDRLQAQLAAIPEDLWD